MNGQLSLFGGSPISRRTDPETSRIGEANVNAGRRGSQKQKILERLKRGPVTNHELAALCLKYTGRISDLRKDGYDIQCVRVEESGVTEYELVGDRGDVEGGE